MRGRTKKRILVTGGDGFLGSHFCERLIESGHDVLCVDNTLYRSALGWEPKISLETGLIPTIEYFDQLLKEAL